MEFILADTSVSGEARGALHWAQALSQAGNGLLNTVSCILDVIHVEDANLHIDDITLVHGLSCRDKADHRHTWLSRLHDVQCYADIDT